MFSLLFSLLSYLPSILTFILLEIRVRLLIRWYYYFPTPTSKNLCRVCKKTLQTKIKGQHQMGLMPASEELSGQQQFELWGQVTCLHHKSVQSLRSSADQNCMICLPVWSSVGDDPDERELLFEGLDLSDGLLTYCHITEASQVDSDLYGRGGNNCIVVSVGFPQKRFPDAPKPAAFVLLPSAEMLYFTHWRLPSYSTNSAQSWYFARFWYDWCLKNHDSCNRKRREQSNGRQWYPTRLIKTSRWSNKLRLVLTEKERPDSPYLTVSHCWGKADIIQLTQSTMSDFLLDIPHRKLPKTFQDVISVARRLGIYYIWIDSLCIIQREESLVDWKLEAPRMDKVYSHAVLNIAASGASDGSKGLFFPRRADTMRQQEIRLDWWFKVKNSIRFTIMDFDYWKHLVAGEPLIRRAWVVQERLLAPRVLHFGSRQLFWECSELDASEHFPIGLPLVLERSDQQSLFKLSNEAVVHFTEADHPIPAHAVWQRALSSYTQASLTKSADKIIALAGIASELSPSFPDGYVAGLWKEYIATELLWYVDLDTVSSRPGMYRAPSFSWASVDGAVIPGGWQKDDILIEVRDAFASTEMSNPFGSVESGFVRLRGPLKQATLWPNPSHKAGLKFARNARARLPTEKRHKDLGTSHRDAMMQLQRWVLRLEHIYAPSNIEPTWNTWCREVYHDQKTAPKMVEESWLMLGADVFLDEDVFLDCDEEPRHVCCLVVTGQSSYCMAVRGLILEPTGRVEGEYRRLGLFMTSHGDSMNILSVPHRSEEWTSREEYDPVMHTHTIVII